jgi:putative ABC transport system permease protein
LAIVGIAAGVALLFSSQIAGESLSSSVAQLNGGIVGSARLQVSARSAQGFPEALLGQIRHLPGVRLAAPLLEVNANALGPKGSESVQLVGADASLTELGGSLVRRVALTPFAGLGAVVLPEPVAKKLGVNRFGQTIIFQTAGRVSEAALYQQLGARQIGPLIDSPVALAPLSFAQELSGLVGHVTRVLVTPEGGRASEVRSGLLRLSKGQLNVEPSDYDVQLFAKASAATNQSTTLFAAISALVGFLLAFNAMLLTVAQRRRLIADLRRDGYTPRAVIAVLVLDAAVLGLIASVIGLALGDELSIRLFQATPGYLASAFAVGSQRVVSWQSVAIAVVGGMAAALLAVLSPLRDILSRDPLAALAPQQASSSRLEAWASASGVLLLSASVAILLAAPQEAAIGMACLIGALLALLPLPFRASLWLLRRVAPGITSAVPHVAVMELRSGRGRALAIAATGAIAVFGSVSIQGAHGDLLHGLEQAAHDENAFTDVWVAPAGSYNLLTTAPFPTASTLEKVRQQPGVRAIGIYRGGLLDYGPRRVWVIAPPRAAVPLVPESQLVQGSAAEATARLRQGGWAILSQALAEEHHLHIGETFTLPSPRPESFRLAALSTNIGWAPGAIVLNAEDYARAWGSEEASAYNVLLAPGVSQRQGVEEIRRALGRGSGLAVQSAEGRSGQQRALSRQGLERLSQIAKLILTAAVLAMAAAMGAMIWQRRPRLAKLKLEGFSPRELRLTIILEGALLLGVGCAAGALAGLLGQQLLDSALVNIINYPVVRSLGLGAAVENLLLVALASIAVVAIPGWFAVQVPAALALQD